MKLFVHAVLKLIFLAIVWVVFTMTALFLFYDEGLHLGWRVMYLENAFPHMVWVYFIADYMLRKKSQKSYRLKHAFILTWVVVIPMGAYVLCTPDIQYYLESQYRYLINEPREQ